MNIKKHIAQAGITIGGTPFEAPPSVPTAPEVGPFGSNIIKFGITSLITLAILFSLSFLIWGGIQWIMSGGDKHGVEVARNKIIYAIVGLVLTLLSLFIVSIIGRIFGVTLIGL